MSERESFDGLLVGWLLLAAVVAPVLVRVSAPYGRHARAGWGPTLPDRAGWVLMEAPAPLVYGLCWALGDRPFDLVPLAFLAMWQGHYLYRAFVYPLRLPRTGKRMPVAIALSGALFNVGNAWLGGRWLNTLSPERPPAWLLDPRFLAGLGLFTAGMVVNRRSDAILRGLRRPGETGYRIPEGGLYRYVSSPNYLGEIAEWTGWAIATWSLPGLAFAVWTAANLAPRALAHHRWYLQEFPEYPRERRALIPGIW
ncbi:DUF1295 domain-containing protein [Myxococcota bacterium]|nr:DUF1295 domain-containing protein [Myxococcota bacterium]